MTIRKSFERRGNGKREHEQIKIPKKGANLYQLIGNLKRD